MLPSYTYPLTKSTTTQTMFSLAFEFTPHPIPPEDVTGLSKISFQKKKFDESKQAVKLISRVKKISDIEDKLNEDKGLHSELLKSSADLLEKAGYDKEKYLKWVDNSYKYSC